MSAKGKVILIPNTLGNNDLSRTIPPFVREVVSHVKLIFAESKREAIRQLVRLGMKNDLDSIEIREVTKPLQQDDQEIADEFIRKGLDIGVISDAGCPAVADPGSEIVAFAHRLGAEVLPLVGPSSIILGLMASGFNGQNFAFHGYLPRKSGERKKRIRDLEKDMYALSQTQIFIETPYRNMQVFEDLTSECQKNTKICLAVNLTMPDEWIRVESAENWKKSKPNLDKKLCLFLIYK